MPSEIILPAGTEFVDTANIPVLIAEALNPKPANEPRLGRQTESDSAEVKSAAFRRYQVEGEHRAMMCCAIDDGKLIALSSSSRRRVTVHEPDSIVMVSELAKYVEQFGISVNVTDKTEAAYLQAAYDETGLNGNAINWRYWVHQLPVISAAQAACLMSALEPDVFANLNERPGKADPAKNIEKARKIQRLAEAQGKPSASPAEWVGWAQAQSLEVHTGFLLAVEEWPETTGVHGDAATAAKWKAAQGTTPGGDDMEQTLIDEKIVTNINIGDDACLNGYAMDFLSYSKIRSYCWQDVGIYIDTPDRKALRSFRVKMEGGRRGDIRHEAIEAKGFVEACGDLKPRELAAAVLLANVSNLYLATTTDLPRTKNSPPPLKKGEAEELARNTTDAAKRYAAFLSEREAAVLLEDCKAVPDAVPAPEDDDGGDVMAFQNEHVALFPLLADYWDKPQSELPEVLRARVGTWVIGWGGLSIEDRMQRVYDYDYLNHPANAEEEKVGWDLAGKENDAKQEIIKWEQMNHENDPIKAKIQDEKLDELQIKLADIERRLKSPSSAEQPNTYMQTTERGAIEESTAVAKTETGIASSPNENETEPYSPDYCHLFDPLTKEGIKILFEFTTDFYDETKGKNIKKHHDYWPNQFRRASRNGLKNAREGGIDLYNPAKVATWLVEKGKLTLAHANRKLANALPARSKHHRNLFTEIPE